MIAEANDLTMELSSLKAEELTDNAGIALRFRDCEFDNYLEVNPDAARNLAACRRYAENWPDMLENGTSLVMTGSCGTGKNHLAVSMAKHIIRNYLASVEIIIRNSVSSLYLKLKQVQTGLCILSSPLSVS